MQGMEVRAQAYWHCARVGMWNCSGISELAGVYVGKVDSRSEMLKGSGELEVDGR